MTLGPRGGFSVFEHERGFAAACPCGWRGPWRGYLLSVVESDAAEHAEGCIERPFDATIEGDNRVDPAVREHPGSVADTALGGADMAHVTRPPAMREGEAN